GQQPDVGDRVPGAGEPDRVRGPERVPGQLGDLQRLIRWPGRAARDTTLDTVRAGWVDDAVLDLSAEGKPRYAHARSLLGALRLPVAVPPQGVQRGLLLQAAPQQDGIRL